jgi:hypothetical protein
MRPILRGGEVVSLGGCRAVVNVGRAKVLNFAPRFFVKSIVAQNTVRNHREKPGIRWRQSAFLERRVCKIRNGVTKAIGWLWSNEVSPPREIPGARRHSTPATRILGILDFVLVSYFDIRISSFEVMLFTHKETVLKSD